MTRETKLLHLREPAALGDSIDGWRVFWLGGWDRGRLFYLVMVERSFPQRTVQHRRQTCQDSQDKADA